MSNCSSPASLGVGVGLFPPLPPLSVIRTFAKPVVLPTCAPALGLDKKIKKLSVPSATPSPVIGISKLFAVASPTAQLSVPETGL